MPLLELGEGVFKTNEEPLASFLAAQGHNMTVVGKGPGVTEIHGVLWSNDWYPEFRDFSHYPNEGIDPGWALMKIKNPGCPKLSNIWSHPPLNTRAISIRTTDDGIIQEQVHWPPRNAPLGGARISVTTLRDIYIYGDGRGLSIRNETTVPSTNGQFTNHVAIDGGHIAVGQQACEFDAGVNTLYEIRFDRFHIDVLGGDKEGLSYGPSTLITWYAPGHIEPGSFLKANGGEFITGRRENLRIIGDWPVAKRI